MFRPYPVILTLALVVTSLIIPTTTEAFPYSRNNPFTSYNVHGTNYASQQWEKNHARRTLRSQNTPRTRRAANTRFRRSR